MKLAPTNLDDRAVAFPLVSVETLLGQGRLLLVMAHPDDETLACGMAIAAAAETGCGIDLLLVTDGEGSHPNSVRYPRDELIFVRSTELRQALLVLTGNRHTDIHRLHLTDGNSRRSDVSDERFGKLVSTYAERGIATIWSNWKGDPHCDHETASMIAADLADTLEVRRWSCPVWGRFEEHEDGLPGSVTFNSAKHNAIKRSALMAYRSQFTDLIADDPSGFRMADNIRESFAAGPEIFIP